jgi:predicted HicB family RNase H-like nuclease
VGNALEMQLMNQQRTSKKTPKILTGFRIHPEVKSLAVVAAEQDNRSLSNYLECLIRQDLMVRKLMPKNGKIA